MMNHLVIADLLCGSMAPQNITEAANNTEHHTIEAIEQNAQIIMAVYIKL